MTWFWLVFTLLLIIFFIIKQHQDRQKVAKILTIIPADKMGVPVAKEVTKSWWEEIRERLKQVGLAVIFVGVGWLLHGCISL